MVTIAKMKFPMMLMNATAIRKKIMDTMTYDPIMFLNIICTSITITLTKLKVCSVLPDDMAVNTTVFICLMEAIAACVTMVTVWRQMEDIVKTLTNVLTTSMVVNMTALIMTVATGVSAAVDLC